MTEGVREDHDPRKDAIAQFAAGLRQLRADAGNPSFRKMAGVSGYISHTTLHEAATGNRLASWETTREFVKACGGDEARWRARWERARDGAAGHSPSLPVPVAAPVFEAELVAEPAAAPPAVPGKPSWSPGKIVTAAVGGAVLLVAATAVTVVLVTKPGAQAQAPSTPATSSKPAGPLYPGDASKFISDVTIPDGSTVKVGETFTKVWEIENSGALAWRGRFLQREEWPVGPADCNTPQRVPIPDTAPGQRVRITVGVTAPTIANKCLVRWKMIDAGGQQTMPGARPVYFMVNVVPA